MFSSDIGMQREVERLLAWRPDRPDVERVSLAIRALPPDNGGFGRVEARLTAWLRLPEDDTEKQLAQGHIDKTTYGESPATALVNLGRNVEIEVGHEVAGFHEWFADLLKTAPPGFRPTEGGTAAVYIDEPTMDCQRWRAMTALSSGRRGEERVTTQVGSCLGEVLYLTQQAFATQVQQEIYDLVGVRRLFRDLERFDSWPLVPSRRAVTLQPEGDGWWAHVGTPLARLDPYPILGAPGTTPSQAIETVVRATHPRFEPYTNPEGNATFDGLICETWDAIPWVREYGQAAIQVEWGVDNRLHLEPTKSQGKPAVARLLTYRHIPTAICPSFPLDQTASTPTEALWRLRYALRAWHEDVEGRPSVTF